MAVSEGESLLIFFFKAGTMVAYRVVEIVKDHLAVEGYKSIGVRIFHGKTLNDISRTTCAILHVGMQTHMQNPSAAWSVVRAKSPEFAAKAAEEKFHALDIEACLHAKRLPKLVDRGTYLFLSLKAVRSDLKAGKLSFESVEVFVMPEHIVMVEESDVSAIRRVEEHFRALGNGDPQTYEILYVLLDEVVDGYLLALDAVGDAVGALEGDVLKNPSAAVLQKIFTAKRSLIEFRRNASAMREAVNSLLRTKYVADHPSIAVYLRDVYEHTVQVIEFIETYRDMLSGTLDIYLSAIANRTNEIMKVLTIYGTIALPLIVVTGFYGMNIRLPLQDWPHAVYFVVAIMIGFAGGVLLYFRRKGWF